MLYVNVFILSLVSLHLPVGPSFGDWIKSASYVSEKQNDYPFHLTSVLQSALFVTV